MSPMVSIGIFGGDLRQVYMAESLLLKGYQVSIYHTAAEVNDRPSLQCNKSDRIIRCNTAHTLSELFDYCNVLIGPIPMSRDQVTITSKNVASDLTIAHIAYLLKEGHMLIGGNIPDPLIRICKSKHIPYYDLLEDEKITILNAIATAEGSIMEAIQSSDLNLHGSNCLILGFGRCAKVLASKLKAMDAKVTVAARSREALAYAYAGGFHAIDIANMKCILPSFQFIFNTVPALVLDKDCLNLTDPSVTIIDIASAPGGVDYEYAKEKNINARLCPGLPGKVAPKSSSDILVDEIISFIKERSD